MSESPLFQPRCAQCGGALQRVRRNADDRTQPALRRYRCSDPTCAWQGLLPPLRVPLNSRASGWSLRRKLSALLAAGPTLPLRALARLQRKRQAQLGAGPASPTEPGDGSPKPAAAEAALLNARAARGTGTGLARSGLWLLAGLALLSLAAVGLRDRSSPPPAQPAHQALSPAAPAVLAAPGVSHDGALLPAGHGLQRVSLDTVAVHQPGHTALQLRHSCRWGVPGRNPYRGTVEQALYSAGLGPEVVQAIAAQVREGRPVDEVRIDNHGIRAQRSGRVFDHRNIAMSYGLTLCLGTQVNFVAGHSERADLYEATDARGRTVAVMIPEVCGNVSVLGEAADGRARGLAAGGAAATAVAGSAMEESVRWMPALLDWDATVQTRYALAAARSVPEPATLACVGLALAWLAWSRRRVAAAAAAARPTPPAAR